MVMSLLWLIKFPCKSREDCKLLKKMTFTSTCPSALSWLQMPVTMATGEIVDYMAVGYHNGTVVLTAVNLQNGDIVSSLSLHSDKDLLTVMFLNMKRISQDQILVLFAKEFYLMVHVVKIKDDKMSVLHTSHVKVETELNITAVCYKDETLLLSTCDGFLFKGSVIITDKGVSVNLHQWNTNFTTTNGDNNWQCYGVDMSDNTMLMGAVLASSRKNYDAFKIRMLKKPLELHIQLLFQESDELERLQKRVEMKIKDQAVPLTRMVDVMETLRIHLWQGNDLAVAVTSHISRPTAWYTLPLKTLRVLRYFLITITLHIPRNPDATEENQEVALAEKNIHKLRDVIIGRYITDSLEVLQSRKEAMTEKDKNVCSSMLQFMEHHQKKYEEMPIYAKMETLRQSFIENNSRCYNCCICGETAAIGDNFTVSCKEGHTFGLCCQTFQPLMETPYRTCSNCKVHAVSYPNRAGLPWLTEATEYCTICENFLFPCI
ncbi:uncharacterized protein LOC117344235 [Pecten maximus]|uniref:uncharacterized protein LOC117344235 n=1 Tax=Pecten maximus TaxID=6579 RepID=UPI0014580CEC|nr:uncharacterized protein LOC117344235 [Pecten maximus]